MPIRLALAAPVAVTLFSAAFAEIGPCKPDQFAGMTCGGGPGAARVIEDTVSPNKRFALAWRLPGADPTEQPDRSDDIQLLLVRLADGAVLAKAKTEYWHTGSARVNRLMEEASWSPDSRLVARAFQQRFDTESLTLFAVDVQSDASGQSAGIDLKKIVEPAVRQRLKRRDRKAGDYVFSVHGGNKLTIGNAGRVRLSVMMWVPKEGPHAHYDVTVAVKRGKDVLRARVTSVKPGRDRS